MNTAIDIIKEEIKRRIGRNESMTEFFRNRENNLNQKEDYTNASYYHGYAEGKKAEIEYLEFLLKLIEKLASGE